MKKGHIKTLAIVMILSLFYPFVLYSANKPTVLYTDIVAGPIRGGENDKGAYLSIFGVNFGSNINDIKVYIGGGEVARYMYLGASRGRPDIQQLSVQLGSAVATGVIRVSVSGVDSNADHTFTVAAGDIYFMSLTGSDTTGNGSFTSPYRTASKIMGLAAYGPGDFLVIRGGTYDLTSGNEGLTSTASGFPDGTRWLEFTKDGSSVTQQLAVMGYPGEEPVVSLGATTANGYCVLRIASSKPLRYITISGFKIDAGNSGSNVVLFGWYSSPKSSLDSGRFVNMQVTGGMRGYQATSSNEYGGVNLLSVSRVPHTKFLGNDIGNNNAYQGCGSHEIYMSHDYTGVEFAYNYVHDNPGGRATLQMAGDAWGAENITAAAYSWTLSRQGTSEYFLRRADGSNPGIAARPQEVRLNSTGCVVGYRAAGTLVPDSWAYGDNDGLGYNTIYYRMPDNSDPDLLVGSTTDLIRLYDSETWGTNDNVLIHDNVFRNLPAEGLLTGFGAFGPIYIYNNIFDTFHLNGAGGNFALALRSLGIVQVHSEIHVYNNTLNDKPVEGKTNGLLQLGIGWEYPAKLILKNNIMNAVTSSEYYYQVNNANLTAESDYNLWYGSSQAIPSWEGVHRVSADPQFVGASQGDFSIRTNRRGTDQIDIAIRRDIQGRLRKTIPSIGAYEYNDWSQSPAEVKLH